MIAILRLTSFTITVFGEDQVIIANCKNKYGLYFTDTK